jgi:hypothetical protein
VYALIGSSPEFDMPAMRTTGARSARRQEPGYRTVKEPVPLHHATMAMPVRGMPHGWTARVLFLRRQDGSIEPYARLVEYMKAYWRRSSTWQNTIARALGLFWDYCQISGPMVMAEAEAAGVHPQTALFRGFATTLVTGSDAVDVVDDLHWPRTGVRRAQDLISAIERFAEWNDVDDVRSKILPDKLRRGVGEAMSVTDILVWARMRNVSMLKHLAVPRQVRRSSVVDLGRDARGFGAEPVKRFPSQHIERLLWEGHARPGMAGTGNPFAGFNVRDQMIAILDAWGGLRRSDGLHLWVNDVQEDPAHPGHALVVLNHPSEASILWPDPSRRANMSNSIEC